ncbi:hypothetical protein Glove_23g256 [Diversispora epigaea]|uniref:Uncharacterized protein n=1 Tax=Diversispora epigaea TaxID=1348612 RepID=A0A397JNG2_9GLOM|nr:hypothetical protein Glove_23g256 [Diversispora epigaea]
MNNIPIPDSLQKRVHELRREFPQILGEAQVIIDNTGAYLVTESTVIEIDQPTNNEITTQYDDMLTMYAVDIFTALEEQDRVIGLDLDELLRIAMDMHGTNGQRMNAYKNLGDYLQDAQLGSTVTVLKRELHERSHQNGARIYQIATRIRSLFQVIGTPYARNFRNVTPDWIYKLPKSEFERFLQLCETMGTQLMEDLLETSESINEWAKLFIELFEEYSSSKLQFPKLHSWVFHICSSIREFGAINGYTTETYESLHKDYVKKPYKLTNKKEIEKQIMKINRFCINLKKSKYLKNPKSILGRKAIITESSSKEIPKTPIALKYSKKLYEFCIQNAEIYIQTRMNDPDLEKEMKLGFEKFLKCLDAYLDFYNQKLSEHEEIDIKFHIYSGVTLKFGSIMHATNKFHKKPIFSNIAVEMNPDEIFEYTSDNGVCFAQVLLITEIIRNYEEPMHLALVQWYDFKSSCDHVM